MSFWTDSKVADEFTPEDKYFYLYLMTNPHTSTCGCYELSIRQMSIETGYSKETIAKLIDRMVKVHNVIRYSHENKEVLLINWRKYNWTSSDKLRKSIYESIHFIKTVSFKNFLYECFENENTRFTDDRYPIDTVSNQDEYPSDTSFSLGMFSLGNVSDSEKKQKTKEPKHEYGEYRHVRLTDAEYQRLVDDYGEKAVLLGIKDVDEYCQEHGKSYKDYNLTLRKWGIKSPKLPKPIIKKTVAPVEDDAPSEEWQKMFEGCDYGDI